MLFKEVYFIRNQSPHSLAELERLLILKQVPQSNTEF
jgi:hypothetical protein